MDSRDKKQDKDLKHDFGVIKCFGANAAEVCPCNHFFITYFTTIR
jgi:hypothetical protein